ncbi:DUF2690 domain-containing protein [Micromonospora sp. NPDC023644]|uniref:DUF2690 domain-containing protein n=1 Tax=Micromonospora sp. NPDC023644 TaxID=3154321 RepID=UPI0034052006
MRTSIRAALLLAALVPLVIVAPGASSAAEAPQAASAQAPSSADPTRPTREEAIAKERYGRDDVTLPSRTVRHADGSVETIADPAAVRALSSTLAAGDACGSACDGKDPASYLAPMPGGPSNYRYCSTDAVTVYTKSNGYESRVELRYSPGCRTAWTRGCCYTSIAGFSYYSSGNVRLSVYNYDGRYNGSSVWTAMLDDAGYTYKACYDTQVGGPSVWSCTSGY